MAESLAEIVKTASALEFKRIVTADGRLLGRVFDVRCQWDSEAGDIPIVDQVIFGKRGLLERMDLRRAQSRFVHWYLVESVSDTALVVSSTKR
jgi:sporulation protein YlmC with PRC-barrel domain